MYNQEGYPVANLENQVLSSLKEAEDKLRATTGEEIILIAYKDEKSHNNIPTG